MDKLQIIKQLLEQHQGHTNPITSSEIAEIIGIDEDDTHSQTRALILKCIEWYELPAVADNRRLLPNI